MPTRRLTCCAPLQRPRSACPPADSIGCAIFSAPRPRTGIVAMLLAQVNRRGSTVPQRTYADFRNLLCAAVEVLDRTPVLDGR